MEEEVLEILHSERKYFDVMYEMNNVKTLDEKIQFMLHKLDFPNVTSTSDEISEESKLEILELNWLAMNWREK